MDGGGPGISTARGGRLGEVAQSAFDELFDLGEVSLSMLNAGLRAIQIAPEISELRGEQSLRHGGHCTRFVGPAAKARVEATRILAELQGA